MQGCIGDSTNIRSITAIEIGEIILERIRLDDLVHYQFLSGIEFDRTGRYLCFVVHKPDLEENDYKSHLWIYDLTEGRSFQLTALGEERHFKWLDDGHILFSSVRSKHHEKSKKEGREATVFYKISVQGGEAQEAFQVPLSVETFKQLDENRFLLTAPSNQGRPELWTLSEEEQVHELKRRKEEQDFEVLEEIPYWSNGGGFTSLDRTRVYLYDASSQKLLPVTERDLDVESVTLNQDRTKALVIGSRFTGKREQTNSLYVLDLETRSVRQVPDQGPFRYQYGHITADGQGICCGSAMSRYGLNENPQFFLVDLNTGNRTNLTPHWDRSAWNSVGSDCRYGGGQTFRYVQDHLFFISTDGSSSFLFKVDLEGKVTRVTNKTGSVDAYCVHDNGIAFIGLQDLALQEVYVLRNNEEEKLTEFNQWVLEQRIVNSPEPLSVETAPDVIIEGWVIKPVDWEIDKKYPAIFTIHGGPKTVFGPVFFHEMQYWANEGYFVFFCDPRGSDGRGNEFADIRGKYGTIDYDDLMAFADGVFAKYPSIDQNRVGVTGGSYGGFMTNWIIGHTNRFRAAASQRSISNWVSMGWTTDIGYYFTPDQIGETPWTDSEKLWEHSPLKYADQVQTPTLFIHSEEDYRCWLVEGLQMFTALKFHGIDARLCLFKGENHDLSRSGRPKQRIRRLREITQWFDTYLKA